MTSIAICINLQVGCHKKWDRDVGRGMRGRGDVGTWDAGTRGRGDVGTWGRGDVGVEDVGTRGRGS